MATITIPSPSAILNSPIPEDTPTPQASIKTTSRKRAPVTPKNRKPSAAVTNGDPKPRQTKSRDGCKNCKEKRLKCDERKPGCEQCEKKGVICKGYEKVLKWRPQEDAFKNKTSPPQPQPRRSFINSKTTLNHTASPSPTSNLHPPTHDTFSASFPQQFSFEPPPISLDPRPFRRTNSLDIKGLACGQADDTRNGFDISSTPSLINGSFDEDDTPQSAKTSESRLWLDVSPRVSNDMLYGTHPKISHQEHMEDQLANPGMSRVTRILPSLESLPPFDEEGVEEILREQNPAESWFVPIASPTSSDSSGSSTGSWLDAIAATVWAQPKMPYDSEETLLLRFDKQTCGILSVKDGPSENPWRTMLWPLAKEHGALRHAITSMTAFHASKDSPGLRVKGMEHMSQSLQLLARGMKDMPVTASLATTLVLAFCESWDMLISTGIRHLQGASHLIAEIMSKYRQGITLTQLEPRLGFLCRTWVYMDVIARLTSLEGDDSIDFDIVGTPLCQLSIEDEMDPLMGCASTLFPMIGRVANLVRKVRQRTQSNSFQIISRAKDLKSRLDKWRPPSVVAAPEDQWTEVEQGFWTAEAYRGATVLYLLQAVPEICYDSVTETINALANEVLRHIANVPVTSGMVIIHIFPLLAAGCEAVGIEDRTFVMERWEAMMRRMKIQNLDRCLDVVKEVWERRDNAVLENGRRAQSATSPCHNGSVRPTVLKRKYSSGDEGAPVSHAEEKRRAIHGMFSQSEYNSTPRFLQREFTSSHSDLGFELTVRGRQHWAGVMRDLGWEVLIG